MIANVRRLSAGWIFGFEFVDKDIWPEKCGDPAAWKQDNENPLYKFMYPVNEYNNIAWCGKFHQLNPIDIGTFLSFTTSGLLTLLFLRCECCNRWHDRFMPAAALAVSGF